MTRSSLLPIVGPRPRFALRGLAGRLGGWLGALLWLGASAGADDLWRERRGLEDRYHQELQALAEKLRGQSLDEPAQAVLDWARPRDSRKLYLVEFPESGSGHTPSSADAPAAPPPGELAPWQNEFAELRQRQADIWFDLARRAVRQKLVSLAFDLVLATARDNPDHEAARRMLGYVRFRDGWHTPYEVRRLRSGQVWDPRFGWLPAAHVPRYAAGERFYNGRWITADEETRLRSDMRRAWQVETEHYLVTTNHSLEAGVHLGVQLERLYRAWQQAFVGYYTSQAQLAQLLEGRPAQRSPVRRHQVVYFRNRQEYNEALRHTIAADIGLTTGLYLNDTRQAYFFAGDGPHDASTLFHEATHQLFRESRETVSIPGENANFWIIEGIACYMESLSPAAPGEAAGYLSLGGAEALRYRDARFRLIDSQFYVPLARLTAASAAAIQHDADIAKLYSQSAGLTHFLMHQGGGRFRDALVSYLVAVYSGQDTPDSLSQLTGQSYPELDAQYREFVLEDQPGKTASPEPLDTEPTDAQPSGDQTAPSRASSP